MKTNKKTMNSNINWKKVYIFAAKIDSHAAHQFIINSPCTLNGWFPCCDSGGRPTSRCASRLRESCAGKTVCSLRHLFTPQSLLYEKDPHCQHSGAGGDDVAACMDHLCTSSMGDLEHIEYRHQYRGWHATKMAMINDDISRKMDDKTIKFNPTKVRVLRFEADRLSNGSRMGYGDILIK